MQLRLDILKVFGVYRDHALIHLTHNRLAWVLMILALPQALMAAVFAAHIIYLLLILRATVAHS